MPAYVKCDRPGNTSANSGVTVSVRRAHVDTLDASCTAEVIGFLRHAEAGMPIKEIGRKHGFGDSSFYKWRSKYGGMDASEANRLRELELENGKLKRLMAEAHHCFWDIPS